ncbi:tetratricopeptide repeat-containing sensor histidine kinase [Flavobacterium sp. UBA6135]|uniref:tetratricopeptide repeat-containing sensor histidine kinase n=1 Tax=Flavobacterium sp. UBA6135 TaxID=1946553 RepID=UPI0025C1F16B|nr:ATP-binding protein [Flavobacterium sp. UBA6135]
MKRFFFISILLLFVYSCKEFSNKPHNSDALQDSIQLYIGKANDFTKSDDEVVAYLDKASSFIKSQERDSIYFINKFYVAFIYDNVGKSDQFKNIMLEVVEEATKESDSVNLARAYSYIGEYYSGRMVLDSAVMNFQQAEKIFFKLKDNVSIGRTHVKMALAKYKARDYIGSEKSAVDALNFIRLENNKLLEYEANSLLGVTCIEIKDFDKAKEYFEKSLRIANDEQLENFGKYQTKAASLNNLGIINFKMGYYKDALSYFNQAIKEPLLLEEHPSLYATTLANLAKSKLKSGDFTNLPEEFYKSLRIRENNQSIPEIVNSKIDLSEYYEKIGKADSAKYYAREAYKMAKSTNILNLQLSAIDQLSNVEPENENAYSKEYIKLSDSLLAAERKVSEKFARIEFETDEIMRQKEQLAIQNRNIIFFSLLSLFIVGLLYIIRDQRNRNAQLRLREAQQRANEEIYNLMLSQQKKLDDVVIKEKQRIAQELHDGVLGRLFGTRLNLDSLNKKNDEKAIQNRDHYISELKNIEQDIREISHELNREKFALVNNFVSILHNLFEEQKTISEAILQTKIDTTIDWTKVDNTVKINLYRIVQESLQNINKYANAKTIIVNLLRDNDSMNLTIQDDGQGFDVSKKSKGIGLQNLESRVNSCGGTIMIKSAKGEGTTIEIMMPFEIPVNNKQP